LLGSKEREERWRSSQFRIPAWIGLAALIVLAAAGCRQFLDDFTIHKDAGREASVGRAHPDGAALIRDAARCTGQTYPPPPTSADAGGDITFVTLLTTTNWADQPVDGGLPPYQRIGLNLDGLCTTSNPATTPCREPAYARADHSDGPLGIDNGVGQATLLWVGKITRSDQANERRGVRAYVVRVTGYNGGANDDDVHVTWYGGTRATEVTEADAGLAHGPWNVFDKYVPNSNDPLQNPQYQTPSAYVSNHTLVAQFRELLLGGPLEFVYVEKAILVAKVVSERGEWTLRNLTLAGRWPVNEMVASLSLILGEPGCAGPAQLTDSGKRAIAVACDTVDINSQSDDPNATCDAVSFGVTFDGAPAELGQAIVTTSPGGACADPPPCEEVVGKL
jgi:hypothetical protein